MSSIETLVSEKKEPIHKRMLSAGKRLIRYSKSKPAAQKKKKGGAKTESKTSSGRSTLGMSDRADELLRVVLFLSIIGILVSVYTVFVQYSTSAKVMCMDCLTVIKSAYAVLFGIPISLICLVGFLFFGGVSLCLLTGYDWSRLHRKFTADRAAWTLIVLASAGALLAVYYTWVQGWALGVWCVMCISLSLLVLAILALMLLRQYIQKQATSLSSESIPS